MILLDTNVVVAFLNGDKSVLKRMRAEIGEIVLSTLVVAELDYGAKVSQKSEENLERLYRLLDVVQVIPFDIECAKVFGTIKSKLRRLGKPTGEVDAPSRLPQWPIRLFSLRPTKNILRILKD